MIPYRHKNHLRDNLSGWKMHKYKNKLYPMYSHEKFRHGEIFHGVCRIPFSKSSCTDYYWGCSLDIKKIWFIPSTNNIYQEVSFMCGCRVMIWHCWLLPETIMHENSKIKYKLKAQYINQEECYSQKLYLWQRDNIIPFLRLG